MKNNIDTIDVQVILVCNKIDMLEDRTVTPEEGQKFADDNKIKYFESSAKTGEGVAEMFIHLAEKIHLTYDLRASQAPRIDAEDIEGLKSPRFSLLGNGQ
jgi:50S ribosomal subunit-associated GTPase HflX